MTTDNRASTQRWQDLLAHVPELDFESLVDVSELPVDELEAIHLGSEYPHDKIPTDADAEAIYAWLLRQAERLGPIERCALCIREVGNDTWARVRVREQYNWLPELFFFSDPDTTEFERFKWPLWFIVCTSDPPRSLDIFGGEHFEEAYFGPRIRRTWALGRGNGPSVDESSGDDPE